MIHRNWKIYVKICINLYGKIYLSNLDRLITFSLNTSSILTFSWNFADRWRRLIGTWRKINPILYIFHQVGSSYCKVNIIVIFKLKRKEMWARTFSVWNIFAWKFLVKWKWHNFCLFSFKKERKIHPPPPEENLSLCLSSLLGWCIRFALFGVGRQCDLWLDGQIYGGKKDLVWHDFF